MVNWWCRWWPPWEGQSLSLQQSSPHQSSSWPVLLTPGKNYLSTCYLHYINYLHLEWPADSWQNLSFNFLSSWQKLSLSWMTRWLLAKVIFQRLPLTIRILHKHNPWLRIRMNIRMTSVGTGVDRRVEGEWMTLVVLDPSDVLLVQLVRATSGHTCAANAKLRSLSETFTSTFNSLSCMISWSTDFLHTRSSVKYLFFPWLVSDLDLAGIQFLMIHIKI